MEKESLLAHLSQNPEYLSEIRKISAFVDLALVETLKKDKEDQLPFLYKQLLSLKDYIGSEISFYSTQAENVKFVSEYEEKKKEVKKKKKN